MQKVSIAIIALAALCFGAIEVLAYAPPVIQTTGVVMAQTPVQETPTQKSYSYANQPVIVYSRQTTSGGTQNSASETTTGTGLANENRPGLLEQLVNRAGGPVAPATAPENICAGETFTSTVNYQNATGRDAVGTAVTVIFPEEIDFVSSSIENGVYNEQTRTYRVLVGPLAKDQSGTLYITATANRLARENVTMAVQVNITFTSANGTESTSAQYANFTTQDCATNLGALALANGFFPKTFTGWLILAILICLIIYFSRRYLKKDTGHGHGGHGENHGHPTTASQMEEKAWNSEHS